MNRDKLFYSWYRRVYTVFFPDYVRELKKVAADCKNLLDLGCGSSSPVKFLDPKILKEGVEIYEPYLKQSKKEKIHHRYHQANVLQIDKMFKAGSFDCVLAGDLIEHLTKSEGLGLIKMMERIAKKKIVIYTPNGFHYQEERDGNRLQTHRSGWEPHEMIRLGYRVIGISGLKQLRDADMSTKFKPKFFWRIISDLTQLLVKNKPEYAAQLLCIKIKDGNQRE